jgi:hypothetical protein
MPVNEKFPRVEPTTQLPVLTENALIATIIIAFLILHLLAGAILLQHASATNAVISPEDATSVLYD